MTLTAIKNRHAGWVVAAWRHLAADRAIIEKGWSMIGLSEDPPSSALVMSDVDMSDDGDDVEIVNDQLDVVIEGDDEDDNKNEQE
eukprot:CAMPEP_0202688694 /NCGR_PEP_ID=MMETSP1385-20130828/4167_1 /ASSEMBLY_ACC=CAM_ASM_000861 /TAXON_ID=933848 /ORGANISM="Elphidium margaritaceum" /LENGTH=84 /DNA_ID=CAMNT_0049343723 /DNA_START=243 /DNA_END=497 /DNA_ORIENTATION=-